MAQYSGAKINGEELPITGDSIILDSGSSINHIPSKEFNLIINVITRDHECKTFMNPLETYFCDCSGANDDTFPTLELMSGNITFTLRPEDYILYEKIYPNDPNTPAQCMIGF